MPAGSSNPLSAWIAGSSTTASKNSFRVRGIGRPAGRPTAIPNGLLFQDKTSRSPDEKPRSQIERSKCSLSIAGSPGADSDNFSNGGGPGVALYALLVGQKAVIRSRLARKNGVVSGKLIVTFPEMIGPFAASSGSESVIRS